MIPLRPYQQTAQDETWAEWNAGNRNVMVVKPTGAGKSVLISDTVRKFTINRQQSLVMAHRRELVGQMSLHVARQGVRHRIIAPKQVVSAIMAEHRRELNGNCFIDHQAACAVGGVDTIMSRIDQMKDYLKAVDLLVCDEGHHVQIGNKWGDVFEACQRALGLLVTATPQRADGKGLSRDTDGVVDALVLGPTMRELIDMGALCEYEIVCPPSDFDLDSLKIGESGDITQSSMKAASEKSKIVGDVVENYCKYAFGKRAVVFTTDVATAGKMAAQFNAWNIPAAAVSADTDSTVRDDLIRRLRDGRLWVIVNVDLLGEGFDLPAIDVVIMARPTASLAVYMQQFGRCLRPMPGKLFGLVIDHVSNIKRFGFPDAPRVWSIGRRIKRKERDPELLDVLICPNTGKPYEAIYIAACPRCGMSHVKPRSDEGTIGRAIEVVAGDLTRLDAATLAEMRKAIIIDPDKAFAPIAAGAGAAAGQRNIAYAKLEAQQLLSDALSEWAGYQRDVHRRSDSEIHRRFYSAVGADVLTALRGDRATMLDLTERVKSWISAA